MIKVHHIQQNRILKQVFDMALIAVQPLTVAFASAGLVSVFEAGDIHIAEASLCSLLVTVVGATARNFVWVCVCLFQDVRRHR